jgi:ATP-dependent RNA helicase DDX1
LKKYVSTPSVSHALIIGGVEARESARQLSKTPDIVTATPGKLIDLLDSGKISVAQIRLLILDEADRFTDDENAKMLAKIYGKIRTSIDSDTPGRLQVCFFSATLHSPEITKLSEELCKHPTWVDLKGKDSVPDTVHHVAIEVHPQSDTSWQAAPDRAPGYTTDGVHDRLTTVAGGKKSLSPEEASEGVKRLKQRMLLSVIESLRMDQCLIFCRTNLDCDNLEAFLTSAGGGTKFRSGMEKGKENKYSCVVLAGMRSMEERRRNLAAFKAGDVRFLICTDVAARGLDIKELPYVVNMTLPDDIENYIHRIGRVGRAERMGLAISLVSSVPEKVWYHQCKNRGQGCKNTKLKESGGCTIWYDEPALLKAITKRLALDHIPRMTSKADCVGPTGEKLSYLFELPAGMGSGIVYGEERGDKSSTSEHVEAIRDQVASLANLEVQAQTAFIALKLRFACNTPAIAGAGISK